MIYHAGLDWGGKEHAVCVIDEHGAIVARFVAAHTAEGLRQLLAALARIAPPHLIPIAIERPDGVLVDTLIDAGHPVVPIHPNAMKASRPRYSAAGSKSDPGDAYILADLLRTDGHRFRVLRPASDEIRALRALVRARDDLVAERVAVANQLRAVLDSFWPGAAVVFSEIDSLISLAFLDRYPGPSTAKRLGEKRMEAFLARQTYSGHRSAAELLERLHAAPISRCAGLEEEAKSEIVKGFVAVLRILVKTIKMTTVAVEKAVAEIPSGRVVMSFPRAGKVNAAQIVAELGGDPGRFPTEAQLAAEAGVAPVTRESGRHRSVVFRFACNKRLRRAITNWADNTRHISPWARDIYARSRARGQTHPHAIRVLARAWIRVLWRCWHDQKPYDPALHGGARGLEKTVA